LDDELNESKKKTKANNEMEDDPNKIMDDQMGEGE